MTQDTYTFIVNHNGHTAKLHQLSITTDIDGFSLLSFEHGGVSITDPFISECGRFDIDPSYYGMTLSEAVTMRRLNAELYKAQKELAIKINMRFSTVIKELTINHGSILKFINDSKLYPQEP